MQTDPLDVLIVGAGPTGLTLACLLARSGVACRIIDASATPPAGSRGKGLQPRSLEVFDDLGIVDRIIAHGALGLKIRFAEGAASPSIDKPYEPPEPRPDRPYQQPLIIPQWRVEEILRDRLDSFGGRVEFGMELRGFTQDHEGVTALVAAPGGPATIRARWLVGCDGGKSTVRPLAGIEFLGETLETHRMLVGDVRVEGLDRDHWHIWRSAEGFLALCPLPSTEMFQFQASIAPGQDSALTLDNCSNLVARRSERRDIRVFDPGWLSLWRANIRMVNHYRAGRVFLAGDAAHVHSPAGGQGMNTGIQDAYNLGWKLAAVAGGADAALLDTYESERLPVAARVLGLSTELMNAAVTNRAIAIRRDDETLQLGIGYRDSSLTRDLRPGGTGLRAGDRAPDAPGLVGPAGRCRIFDLLRGPQVTVLGFGEGWRPLIEGCAAQCADGLKGYILVGTAGDPRSYVDSEGHAGAAYDQDALFVIRPDNYVGLATTVADPEAVVAYLGTILT